MSERRTSTEKSVAGSLVMMESIGGIIAKKKEKQQSHSHLLVSPSDEKDKVREMNVSLQDLKSYLHENKHLLMQDKNKFTAETLMMLLDNDKLAALEDEFNEHPNGIELSNFVWLMKCAIVHSPAEKFELMNGLIKLFQDIDINGDHQMEWSEFTQYIIDAVIGERDAKFFDGNINIFTYTFDSVSILFAFNYYTARFERERELTEFEIFDRAYSKKTKRYFPSKNQDNSTHQSHVKKAIFSSHTNAVICLEQNSSKLKFYTLDCKEMEVAKKKFMLQPPQTERQQPFILDFTIAEDLNMIVASTSDRQLLVWENNLTTRIMKRFNVDVLQSGIWYLPVHKMWISAGADYNIRTWKFSEFEDEAKIKPDKFMLAHLKIITSIEELISPRLIASGSLDGRIKLWDLTDPAVAPILLTELRDPNQDTRGILGLSYSGHYGSNLLSYGFEMHINIWCPEVSITRAFIGKLEGHSRLVQICKFMDMSPNVISIDDGCNTRIWDIRSMNTIQVINSDGSFSVIYDVAILSAKYDMFVLAGKRLAYYENDMYSKRGQNNTEEVAPLSLEFNTYFNQFCVITKTDMRIYDAMTGKLKKVLNDLVDEKYPVDLSTFCLGARHRKFFVADNIGLIRQYNMKNSELLKHINSLNETESAEFTKKQAKMVKRKDNNQISQMLYVADEKLLIAAFYDSTIRIYDEGDAEETVLLKVMTGGHNDSEITVLAYSEKFSLLATGSANGRIAVWEFESGKLESIMIAREKGEITTLAFGEPYPVLISGSAGGVINVWGIKGSPPQYRYKSIGRFVNSYWESETSFTKVGISYLVCETSISEGTQRVFVQDKYTPIQRSSFDPMVKEERKEDQTSMKKKRDTLNFTANANTQFITAPTNNFLTENSSSAFPDTQEDQIKGQGTVCETISDYQSYFDAQAKSLNTKKRRFYVIVGDVKGMMHVLNFTEILSKRGVLPLRDEKKKQYFQLHRKDFINAQKSVDAILNAPDRRNEKLPPYVHFYNSILVNRWEAHSGQVNHILRIPEPLAFVTCSADKTIKIWSLHAECQGRIFLNRFGKNEWHFPFDWVEKKLKDMDDVFVELGQLEDENLTETEKEDVKMKYLSNQFFDENTIQDLKQRKHDALYPPKVFTDDEIRQKAKEELYHYRIKPKPKMDPIVALRMQIREEDEKASFFQRKNEPFRGMKNIENDMVEIKQFYKILPANRPTSSFPVVQALINQLETVESSQSNETKQETNRKPSGAFNNLDSQHGKATPHHNNNNKSSSRYLNISKSQKNFGNQSVSQSALKQQNSISLQPGRISAFSGRPTQSQVGLKNGISMHSASLTSLVRNSNVSRSRATKDIYKRFDFQYIRPATSNSKSDKLLVKDVKYSSGEAGRAVRLATDAYTYQQQSLAPLQFFKDNELARTKNQFYVDLAQNYDGKLKKNLNRLNVGGEDEEKLNYDSDDSDRKQKKKTGSVKIVATSTFLNNPNRNKHKVLKTGEKIYVIEQDG